MPSTDEHLPELYAPLVRRLALQLAARLPANVELDDLVQAGMLGLLDALRRYQYMQDAQFETYAVTRIRGAMLDELRSQDWLPRSVRTKARQIEQAIGALNQKLLRAPSETEIARQMGVTLADYRQMLEGACGVQVFHYEDLAAPGADRSPEPVFTGDAAQMAQWRGNPLNQLINHRMRQALIDAIEALPERERLLLSLLFEQDLNQREISAVMGVTEGRVSQIRSQAIARIRAALASQQLEDEMEESALQAMF